MVMVAVPVTTLQAPVPTDGLLPARVKVPLLQLFRSTPAVAVVGFRLNVTNISSIEVHTPLVVVHRRVYALPAVPVKVEDMLFMFPNEPPMPLTILHEPVPTVSVVAAIVTVVRPQVEEPVWSAPALAVVGFRLNVIITSSVEAVQGLLLMVHSRV